MFGIFRKRKIEQDGLTSDSIQTTLEEDEEITMKGEQPELDDPEADIINALREYSRKSYRIEFEAARDPAADLAAETLTRALEFAAESGLTTSLCYLINDGMEHWHAWIEWEGFYDYVNFDAANVFATCNEIDEAEGKETHRIKFEFRGHQFEINIQNNGYLFQSLEMTGTAHLWIDGQEVLGIDTKKNAEYDNAKWQATLVTCLQTKFQDGKWMKVLLEAGSQAEARREQNLLKGLGINEKFKSSAENIDI